MAQRRASGGASVHHSGGRPPLYGRRSATAREFPAQGRGLSIDYHILWFANPEAQDVVYYRW
jgi:hypothetical protein